MKEYFINLKNDKNKLWLFEIVSVLVLSLGFTLALKYISKKINTSLVSANINVIYKGDSKITKDLFLPIKQPLSPVPYSLIASIIDSYVCI